jgi:hypothetical protein
VNEPFWAEAEGPSVEVDNVGTGVVDRLEVKMSEAEVVLDAVEDGVEVSEVEGEA